MLTEVALVALGLGFGASAGAATLGELCMLGRPALLVPSPFVAENHQEKNARALEAAGGCRVLLEDGAQFVCVDGPEFDGHQVDFNGLMSRARMYHTQERQCKGDGSCHK